MNSTLLTASGHAYPVYDDPLDNIPGGNCICTYSGGNRFGIARFLMLRSDYTAMAGYAGSGGEVRIDMYDGTTTLTFYFILVGALSYSSAFGGSSASIGDQERDMVEAVLFDKRCLKALGINKAYNVQKDGLSVDSNDSLEFYSTTLSNNNQWSWSGALTNTSVYDGSSVPSTPAWKPRNLIFDGIPSSRVLDVFAAHLGWIVGYDYATEKYTLWTPDQQHASNAAALDYGYLLSGGLTQRHSARLPSAYTVQFPAKDLDNADPFTNRRYTKSVSTGGGNPGVDYTLHIGNYVAIWKDGAWYNQTELDAVATDVAAREFAKASVPIGEFELIGLRNVRLDGRVRGIKWVNDCNGARTIIRFNDERDFNPMQDLQRLTETISNQLVIGGGSTIVGLTMGGTRIVWGGSGGAAGNEAIGTEQYQHHQMITQNTDGWEFPLFHP